MNEIVEIVKGFRIISEINLMNLVWKSIPAKEFDKMIISTIRKGEIKRIYLDTPKRIYYISKEVI